MEKTVLAERSREEMGLDKDLNEMTFKKVKECFGKWLYIEDELVLDVVFATVVANRFLGDPVWLFLISAPGGSKSEILRALGTLEEIYMLSSLTENTLISGLKNKTDPSLIPKLDGKILVIKDFTAILSIHKEARASIIGDLRDAYDGECSKTFGTGERKSYKSKFGLIAGVTPVIDKHWAVQADLGERFLRFRIRLDNRQKAIERADANAGLEQEMRGELSSVSKTFLSSCEVPPIGDIKVESELSKKIMSLAHLLALGRSRVSRDGRDGTIDYEPDPEVGTRIAKQLKLLVAGFACIHDQDHINENSYELVRRVCRDTLPSREAKVLQTMFLIREETEVFASTQEVGDRSGFPTDTCKKVLEDFRLLQIVEREGEGKFKWRLAKRYWELCQFTGLFIPF
jgi:hypothetical protein